MHFWFFALAFASPSTRVIVGLDTPDHLNAEGWPQVQQLVQDSRATFVHATDVMVILDTDTPEAFIKECEASPRVAWVERDQHLTIRPRNDPDDPLFKDQWSLQDAPERAALEISTAWALAADARNLGSLFELNIAPPPFDAPTIAIIDDGIDRGHPDFNALDGANFADNLVVPAGNGNANGGFGDHHGTQVAGVAAAIGNNAAGIAGVCPVCKVLPVRVYAAATDGPQLYEANTVATSAAAAAITWAVNAGASVINCSWGPPDGPNAQPFHTPMVFPLPAPVRAAIDHANASGTVVVWAAGNGNEPVAYDGFASYRGVIAVGATTYAGQRADASDYGIGLDLMAPGYGSPTDGNHVVTTDIRGATGRSPTDYTYRFKATSASAPVVAGVVALLQLAYPGISPAQVMEALYASARRLDPSSVAAATGWRPFYGHGNVDPVAALLHADTYDRPGTTDSFELCGNGVDDNGDGLTDADEGCDAPEDGCTPNVTGEVCDGVDNDCDTFVDEGFVCVTTQKPTCAPCTGSGVECNTGLRCYEKVCMPECDDDNACPPGLRCNSLYRMCSLDPAALPNARDCLDYHRRPQTLEFCDGLDNDGNGSVDDLPEAAQDFASQRCTRDTQGVCRETRASCTEGRWTCTPPASYASEEATCDGLDNDCDGLVDESLPCDVKDGCQGCAQTGAPSLLGLLFVLLGGLTRRAWTRS